jgi:hypothetical protein
MGRRRAVAYDPNNFNRGKGRRRGKVSVDVDAQNLTGSVVFYGAPTPPDNGYIITSDSNTKFGISTNTATPVFWTATDSDIISVVNGLPGNTTNITTSGEAFKYLADNNYYVLGPSSKTTPTDKLIFEVDARRMDSYPTTGNTWYDISPENNHMSYTYNNSNIEYEDATKSMYRTVLRTQADHYRSANTYDLDGDFTMIVLARVESCHNGTANGLLTNHSHAHNTGAGITVRTITNDADFRISCNTGTGSSRTFHTYYGTSNIKDKWSHLMVHYSGNTLSLWVNGVKEYTRSYSMASRADHIDLFNWSTTYNSNSNYRPKCKIQYGKVYEKALTNAEISSSYYQGDIVTDGLIRALDFSNLVCWESGSADGRDLTLNDTFDLFNTPVYTTDFGGGISCNATNEFIALADKAPTNYVSAECWFRKDTSEGGENIIFNKENSWEVKEQSGAFYWALMANNKSWFWDPANASISVGETCQIVLTYDGNYVKFYKNGQLTDTYTYPSNGILGNQTTAWPKLNSRATTRTSSSSLGDMSYFQFRIYNKALSDGEVAKNFNAQRGIFGL